jgi:hypothetical protein
MKHRLVALWSVAALAATALFAAASAQQPRLEGAPGYQRNEPPRVAQPRRVEPQRVDPPRTDVQRAPSGPGEVFNRGPGPDRNRDWDRDRGRQPDFQTVQAACSRAAIREAWDRGFYSAQYEGGPRLVDNRRGWEMRGRVRLHDRRGYSFVDTVCDLRRNGEVQDFDFLR